MVGKGVAGKRISKKGKKKSDSIPFWCSLRGDSFHLPISQFHLLQNRNNNTDITAFLGLSDQMSSSMLSGPELCSGEAMGEPQCRTTKGACLEPHKDPDRPTLLRHLRLQEPP